MKRIPVVAAFLGTWVEVYDFSIFAFLIPILTEVFFSSHAKQTAINFTILAYVISFGVRPLGALAFGYLIDSYGRKRILLATTLLMIFATAAIGMLPTNLWSIYQGVLLIALRILQGIALSGEFSTAIILSVEGGKERPAFFGSFAFMGGSLGLLSANLIVFILLNWMPHEQMIQYGWRIPFLISTFFLVCLFFIRNKINEDLFDKSLNRQLSSLKALISGYKKELISIFIVSCLSGSAFYITFIYMPTFLSESLSLHTHQDSILITLIGLLTYLLALPLGGYLADKIGINTQIKLAAVLYLLFSYVCFTLLLELSSLKSILLLMFFALMQAFLNSALPAYMINQFHPAQRGKALAISYNVSLALFGGLMPYLILTKEIHLNPGIPISICAIFTVITLYLNREKYGHLRSKFNY